MTSPVHVPPTLEEWRALFDAAAAFRSDAPWAWMTDAMLFGVQNPESGETGYCCVLGAGGISYGLNVYTGTRGLLGYSAMLQHRRKGRFDTILLQCCHSASFEDRQTLQKEDLDVIRALGLRFRGRAAWPMFRDYLPGYYPWFLSGPQARFLTIALEQTREVALRFREDPDLLLRGETDQFLVRRLEMDGRGMHWTDRYLAPDAPQQMAPTGRGTFDHQILERVSRSITGRTGTWEVDHRYVPSPIREAKDRRPYFPKALTLVDGTAGFVLHTHLSDPAEPLAATRTEVLRAMSHIGIVPAVFQVLRPDVMDIVLPIANALAIEVRQAKRLPETDRFHREMAKMMEGRG
jgi:hypothetical protein